MSIVVRWLVFLTFLLCLCGFTKPETIKLKFAWPVNKRIKETYSVTKIDFRNGQEGEAVINGHSIYSTKKHPKGLQIDFLDSKWSKEFEDDEDKAKQEKLKKFYEQASNIKPSYVISEEGTFIDVLEIDEIKQSIEKIFEDISLEFPDFPEREKALGFLNKLYSKSYLFKRMSHEWIRDVGQWVGAELEQEAVYQGKFKQSIPILGKNVEVPIFSRVVFVGRSACHKKDQIYNCVDLRVETQVDEEGAMEIIRPILSEFSDEELPKSINLKFTSSFQLITEPDTLLPHQAVLIKNYFSNDPNTEIATLQKREIKKFNYSYR